MRTRWSVVAAATILAAVSAAPASAGGVDAPPKPDYQMKVMVRGAPIHGANGLAVDADGRLLVASAFGAEIVVLDG